MAETKILRTEFDPNATNSVNVIAWTPTPTGFSANPTMAAFYCEEGKVVDIWFDCSGGAGTSNSTGFTITNLPRTPSTNMMFPMTRVIDNGVTKAAAGRIDIAASSTTATLYVDGAATAWTASGNKAAFFHIRFPIA